MDKETIYKKPHEQSSVREKEQGQHTIELFVEGKVAGKLTYEYFSKPVPTYLLSLVRVDPKYRGKGYGADLIEELNSFLVKKKRMGVLINALGYTPKEKIYTDHGWKDWGYQNKNEPSMMVQYFNPPKWANQDEIDKSVERILSHPETISARKNIEEEEKYAA